MHTHQCVLWHSDLGVCTTPSSLWHTAIKGPLPSNSKPYTPTLPHPHSCNVSRQILHRPGMDPNAAFRCHEVLPHLELFAILCSSLDSSLLQNFCLCKRRWQDLLWDITSPCMVIWPPFTGGKGSATQLVEGGFSEQWRAASMMAASVSVTANFMSCWAGQEVGSVDGTLSRYSRWCIICWGLAISLSSPSPIFHPIHCTGPAGYQGTCHIALQHQTRTRALCLALSNCMDKAMQKTARLPEGHQWSNCLHCLPFLREEWQLHFAEWKI